VSGKKALERLFVNEVAAIFPDFPPGTIVNTERPDFLISGGSQVTGIEVVNYVRGQDSGGSDYRRNEMLWQQIADEARREFESNHSAPLMVHFLWHSDRYLRKADVPRMAVSAAKIIAVHMPQNIFESTRIVGDKLVGTPLHALVSSIRVTRVRNRRQASWSSIVAGFMSVTTNELQQLIASKSINVPEYLQRCDEVWLLIVADGSYISSTAELSEEEVRQAHLLSLFQKVLFYDRPNRRITTLTG
jgi:hypothetical protein